MRENILFSLLAGIIAYSITVLISLISGFPLPQVLYNGLIALFLISIGILLLTVYLDRSDFNQSTGNRETQNNDNSTENEAKNSNNENEEDEFSPMDPTVLEVEEEEEN